VHNERRKPLQKGLMFRHYRSGGREALLSQNIILSVARYIGNYTKQLVAAVFYMDQKYESYDCTVGRGTTVPSGYYDLG
jgi:hypothetical protein